VPLADDLAAAGVRDGRPVALVVTRDGLALAWDGGARQVPLPDLAAVAGELARVEARWVWWSARETAAALVAAGFRPRACWDLAAVSRLLHGTSRDDVGAVWAAYRDLSAPPAPRGELDLLDLDEEADGEAVRRDGHLSREWVRGGWADDLARAQRWADLALEVQAGQEAALRALPDPRAEQRQPPLPVLTAYAESGAALLAVELEADGLPLDRDVATALIAAVVGPRPVDPGHAAAQRRARDDEVLRLFPDGGDAVDLRNPAQVRVLLSRIGLDVPDTRSWRLEPHAESLPPVAALLAWRKAERLSTTYGWGWLDRDVGADGRLRGGWSAAEGAGRMSAQAGLHNMPAELRPAVRAEPGWMLVRADLGQVEPRVLAVVSGDAELAAAAREADMYAPVAAALHSDRPTAKVAVLAAMYGQTSGSAGAALRDMDRAYPRAMAYLRAAEDSGRFGRDLRTYGGRLLRLQREAADERFPPSAWGRFARNAVVQGAAAELFKAWAVTVRARLAPIGGEVVLCLHDELLLHVPVERADEAAALLVSALDATERWWAAGSGVRFVADVSVGDSWADAH
jgi:DNA polymerase-1